MKDRSTNSRVCNSEETKKKKRNKKEKKKHNEKWGMFCTLENDRLYTQKSA